MFYIVFGDFLNNIFSDFNSVWHKTPSISTFDFLGATGLEKVQGQGPRFGIFDTDKMS
jgi:hypothetical protein